MKRLIVLGLFGVALMFGQADNGDTIVSVPERYVSAEGLTHQQTAETSKWIGIGKEIGIATRDGLNAVVDTADKFGSTKVGTFVMVMIAWRIMARDILGIVLGIPVAIAGVCLWMWIARRIFFGYRVLDKKEGHTKIYKDHEAMGFMSGEAKATAALFMGIGLAAWLGLMVFAVIF